MNHLPFFSINYWRSPKKLSLLSLRLGSSKILIIMTIAQNAQNAMNLTVEIEQEEDGRWIAEVIGLPGVLAYGQTPNEAVKQAQALALRVLADRLEYGEGGSTFVSISFQAA
ncbi:MAG: type II toxin-antitoxin system HicB family antitoxin [Synechocystis sp.]|nr:type II toxin-antitoxin system HicB family antitoxin [Synechocystis sp.]